MNVTDARKDNLYFFNNVRAFVVILVVLLHAALAYSVYTKKWWIAVSADSSVAADLICGSFDIILMPILFFISGFFTPQSFDRSGAKGFIRKKIHGLYIPWLAGVMLLNPFLVIMVRIAHGDVADLSYVLDYFKNFISFPDQLTQDRSLNPYFFSHYHLWYLSLLFYFSVVYTFLMIIILKIGIPFKIGNILRGRRMIVAVIIFILLSGTGYSIMKLIFGETWFVISIVQFQLSRIIPYLCFFAFGITAVRNCRTIPGPEQKPELIIAGSAVLMPCFLLISEWLIRNHTPAGTIVYGILRYTLCYLVLVGILGTARKYFNTENRFNRIINRSSFVLYLLHLNIVIMLTLFFTRIMPLHNPVFGMFVIFAMSSCIGISMYYLYASARSLLLSIIAKCRKAQ